LKALSKNLIRFTVSDNLEEFHQKLREELVSFGNNWDNLLIPGADWPGGTPGQIPVA